METNYFCKNPSVISDQVYKVYIKANFSKKPVKKIFIPMAGKLNLKFLNWTEFAFNSFTIFKNNYELIKVWKWNMKNG